VSQPRRPRTESELIELLRSSDVRAPEAVHQRVQELVDERSGFQWPWRRSLRNGAGADAEGLAREQQRAPVRRVPKGFAWRLGGAVAAAAVAGALVAGLTGGGSSGLTVREASALTLREATAAAPPHSKGDRPTLAVTVNGVPFPYWEDRFGWRAMGMRNDRVAGREVTTVFYGNRRGQTIGYSIASGSKPPRIGEGMPVWRGGVRYWLLSVNDMPVVTWLRDGHLCVVSGRGVSGATLLRLASWTDHGLAV
jgi:hypothetical protein